MKDENRIIVFDTTLRDGEQSPGASMNQAEKLRIATQLEKLGVDVIEAGFPAASEGDYEAVKLIANTLKVSQIAALCRASEHDIKRGWDAVAQVRATAVVDVVASDSLIEEDDQTLVPIGGIAYAGARGISKVEVKIDDGEWVEAQLREPLSDLTWVIWRYDWPFEEGEHTFAVRCYEGGGTLQITEDNSVLPSGATGIHEVTQDL